MDNKQNNVLTNTSAQSNPNVKAPTQINTNRFGNSLSGNNNSITNANTNNASTSALASGQASGINNSQRLSQANNLWNLLPL